jgi:hypothetical protein
MFSVEERKIMENEGRPVTKLQGRNLVLVTKKNGEQVLLSLHNNTSHARKTRMLVRDEGAEQVLMKSGRISFERYKHEGTIHETQHLSATESLNWLESRDLAAVV